MFIQCAELLNNFGLTIIPLCIIELAKVDWSNAWRDLTSSLVGVCLFDTDLMHLLSTYEGCLHAK